MAYAIVQSKRVTQASDATSWSATFDSTTTSGNLILAMASPGDTGSDTGAAMSFADGGTNTFTSVAQINGNGANAATRLGLAYKENCTGKASHQITVTPTATGSGFLGQGDLIILELSGIKTSSSLDGSANTAAAENSTATATGKTPTAAGVHIAVMDYSAFGSVNPAVAGGWTDLFDPTALAACTVAHRAAVASTLRTSSWTLSATPEAGWRVIHAVFLESSAVDQALTGLAGTAARGTCGVSISVAL